mgnify:FL=1
MNNKAPLVLFIFCLFSVFSFAQVGIGTTTPDASSILEINSTTAGALMPRMTSAQRSAILNPANGLLVFDTDVNAFFFYDTDTWVQLLTSSTESDYTGWADYTDTQYTSGSPYLLAASTQVTLPNNAGSSNESQIPVDVTEFYDSATQTITGRNGDGINITIECKLRPTTSSNTRVTLAIDIGGAVGEIYPRDFVLAKGNGIEHFYLSSFNAYTLGTWEANGGSVRVSSTAPVQIYDIRYVITRTHKAR